MLFNKEKETKKDNEKSSADEYRSYEEYQKIEENESSDISGEKEYDDSAAAEASYFYEEYER